MPGYSLQFPIRVPDDVLVELGEFTGPRSAPAAAHGNDLQRKSGPNRARRKRRAKKHPHAKP